MITMSADMGPERTTILVDLHCHSIFSHDSCSPLWAIERICRLRGIDRLAITDHNEIEGALRLRERPSGIEIIVGEEIATSDGEIIGLFLTERIAPNLSVQETIAAIREQGALVYLPHPFDRGRQGSRWVREKLEEIAQMVDVVEGFNARVLDSESNRTAAEYARDHDLPMGAGSDAHTPFDIGSAVVSMGDFRTPQEFLIGLRRAKIKARPSSRAMRVVLNRYTRTLLRHVMFP